jgi:hypothetical protein
MASITRLWVASSSETLHGKLSPSANSASATSPPRRGHSAYIGR